MKYDQIYWHDGNISSITYQLPESGQQQTLIEMVMSLYKDQDNSILSDYTVQFPNVTEVLQSIDFTELTDNVEAGSIQWIDQKELLVKDGKSYLYTVTLCGGRFVIYSDQIIIKKKL